MPQEGSGNAMGAWWVIGRVRYRYKLAPRVVSGCGRDSPRRENPTGRRTEVETINKDMMNYGEVGGACHKEGITGI